MRFFIDQRKRLIARAIIVLLLVALFSVIGYGILSHMDTTIWLLKFYGAAAVLVYSTYMFVKIVSWAYNESGWK